MAGLPPPRENQAYCRVSALDAGFMNFPLDMFLDNGTPGSYITVPSLSFLIRHSQRDDRFVFDLGIRKDLDTYPPCLQQLRTILEPVCVPQDVVESLAKGGLSPADISTVCLSHCHWDHTGDTKLFPKSTFLVGADSASLLNPGYPADPSSEFESDILPPERTKFLHSSEWPALGPFPHALDYYEDGSLYVVDAAGHLPGHLIAIARTSADSGWILLGGDSAHHWALITGKSGVAVRPSEPGIRRCVHRDKEAAELNMKRIREFSELPRTKVILAHDEPWRRANRGGDVFWPGEIPSA